MVPGNPAPAAFPRAAKYDPGWIRANALGENALCQVESLTDHIEFSVDIAFTRELADIADAPGYPRAKFASHWSRVHTLEWWQRHWHQTGLVDIECAEHLPESRALLRDYADGRPPEQPEDSIMRAIPQDDEELISLFRLVARRR